MFQCGITCKVSLLSIDNQVSDSLFLLISVPPPPSLFFSLSLSFSLSLPPCQTWYKSILPLYFPRTKEEEALGAKILPADLGDEFGEPIIQERKIRILDNPVIKGEEVFHAEVYTRL